MVDQWHGYAAAALQHGGLSLRCLIRLTVQGGLHVMLLLMLLLLLLLMLLLLLLTMMMVTKRSFFRNNQLSFADRPRLQS
jgi:uncharacterized membrane protein